MNENLFVRVPESLYDALRHGEVTPTMFNVMCLLHRWANWRTGVVRTCSAQRLATAMGGDSFDSTPDRIPSTRTIQRSMQGLCEAGWLISHYKKGSKKSYPVEISNYTPVADDDGDGDAHVTLIRPTETKSWAETSVCRVADEDADEDGEGTVRGRGKGGLNYTSHETSHETAYKTSSNKTSTNGNIDGWIGSAPPISAPVSGRGKGSKGVLGYSADISKFCSDLFLLLNPGKDPFGYEGEWLEQFHTLVKEIGQETSIPELLSIATWGIKEAPVQENTGFCWSEHIVNMKTFCKFIRKGTLVKAWSTAKLLAERKANKPGKTPVPKSEFFSNRAEYVPPQKENQ